MAMVFPIHLQAFFLAFFEGEGELPAMAFTGIRRVGVAQAVWFKLTGEAFRQAAFKEDIGMPWRSMISLRNHIVSSAGQTQVLASGLK